MQAPLTRVEVFLQWLRCLLFQMLLEAVNLHDRSEALWRSALGCLLHLVSTGGHPDVECMAGLSNAPLAVLLHVAQSHAWYACISLPFPSKYNPNQVLAVLRSSPTILF